MSKLYSFRSVSILSVLTISIIGWGCNKEHKGELHPNVQPIARLANVPPSDYISKNPRLTLYWVGDDPDGYVVAFRYRWNFRLSTSEPFEYKAWSTLLNIGIEKNGTEKFALMTDAGYDAVPGIYTYFATLPPEGINPDSSAKIDRGDSIVVNTFHVWASNPTTVRFPVHVNPNGGTFIFDSQDSLNPHTFEVESIDNEGDTSLIANVFFQTPQVPPPHTQIVGFPIDTLMVSDVVTDVFPGIPFTFQGFDPNSRTVDYSWVVDRDEWDPNNIPWSPFSPLPTATVSAADFVHPQDTSRISHRLYVRARNEFGSIDTAGYFLRAQINNGQITGYDTVWAYQDFQCVYPKWLLPNYPKRILLLSCSSGFTHDQVDPNFPSRDDVDAYYRTLFTDSMGYAGKFDIIRASSPPDRTYFPSLRVFANYSSVFLYADVLRYDQNSNIEINVERLTSYVDVGGKMVMSGWIIPWTVGTSSSFLSHVPHLETSPPARQRTRDSAFIGGIGLQGYPDVKLDSAKVAMFKGGLQWVFGGRPIGFGEIIYTFHEKHCQYVTGTTFCDRTIPQWEGQTVGVKYDGLTYKVTYFGFPLYYCEKPTVAIMLRKAFSEIGE